MNGKCWYQHTIFSQTGGSVGIGFAISSVSQVVDQLVEYGRTRRGWLGVYIQEVTEDIAEDTVLMKPPARLSNVTKVALLIQQS